MLHMLLDLPDRLMLTVWNPVCYKRPRLNRWTEKNDEILSNPILEDTIKGCAFFVAFIYDYNCCYTYRIFLGVCV